VTLHSESEGTPPAPDAAIARRAARPSEAEEEGEAAARLRAVITQHASLVWRALRRFGVPERDTADAAQHVFLTFVQHAADVEAGKEAGYLAAVAVRVAANVRRKLERSPEVLSDELDQAASARDPEQLLNEKQLREQLDRGLSTLPFEQRTVFVLFELEGFTLPEIADSLTIPLGTATSRLRRARAGFEAWVAERCGENS
jgi:RNA polymerase sigma-70 factor (ECF subfamily)